MNKNRITKKSIMLLGAVAAIAAPIAITVGCGSTSSENKDKITPPLNTGKTTTPKPASSTQNPPVLGESTTTTVSAAADAQATGYADLKYGTFNPDGFQGSDDTVTTSSDILKINDKKNIDEANRADPTNAKAGGFWNKELQGRSLLGQPYTGHFFFEDLAKPWHQGKDADDAYLRATVPLQKRELGDKVISSQEEHVFQPFITTNLHTSNTKVGTQNSLYDGYRMMTNWSHMTSVVSWGGADDEGQVLFPSADQINSAHRNGVPLLGTLFIQNSMNDPYNKLSVKAPDGTYPVADSLVNLAVYYGFDGWFLNFESYVDIPEDSNMYGFIKYFYDEMHKVNKIDELYNFGKGNLFMGNKDKKANWFDYAAMDQNGFYPANSGFYQNTEDEKRIDGFNWGEHPLSDWSRNGIAADKHNNWIFAYNDKNGFNNDDSNVLSLYNGISQDGKGLRDPRLATKDEWKGISLSHQEHTTFISRRKFSTSFDMGIGTGHSYKIDGKDYKMASNGYLNPGLQDIMPTYTWINDQYNSATDFSMSNLVDMSAIPAGDLVDGSFAVNGTPWIEKVDHSKPYNGDSNLHYTGAIDGGKSVVNKLYASKVELKANDSFTVVSDDQDAKLAVWSQIDYDTTVVNDLVSKVIEKSSSKDLGNGEFELTYKIPADLEGKTMTSFGLAFSNDTAVAKNIDCHIGNITFIPVDEVAKDNYLTSLTQGGTWEDPILGGSNVRFNWTMQDAQAVDHYVIWSTKPGAGFEKDKIKTLTSLPAAYIKDIGDGDNVNLVIDAVAEDNSILSSNKVIVKVNPSVSEAADYIYN